MARSRGNAAPRAGLPAIAKPSPPGSSRWRHCGRALIAIGVVALAPLASGATFPATDGQPTVVLSGSNYVDAHAFAARYGLEVTWIQPARRVRLGSAWTTIELEADRGEISYNGLRVFLGDGVLLHRGRLWVSRLDAEKLLGPLLRPALHAATARAPRTIVIDPGHGGTDTGTRHAGLKLDEKKYALDVAQRLGAILEREGYRVVLTRQDDRFVPLADRAGISNRAKADVFISIHFNSAVPAVRGIETYVLTPQHQRSTGQAKRSDGDREPLPGHRSDPWNAVLGFQIHRQLVDRLEAVDRGLKRARYVVLREVECPAVLVEAGYLSNDAEARKIATPAYRSAVAEAIAHGLATYASQVAAAQPH